MIPQRLYELLPALYIGVGILALLAASDPIGLASATLLIAAGATIARMRWVYRTRAANTNRDWR